MTASPDRRRRRTWAGAGLTTAFVVVAAVLVAVAVTTLRTSEEGEAVVVDPRPVESFPATPNAALAIVDDEDRLVSLAIATLDPSGVGGSLAVVPSNADVTSGFAPTPRPLSRQPFTPGDADSVERLVGDLEPTLSLTVEAAEILGPAELAASVTEVIGAAGRLDLEFSDDVVDSDTLGTGIVVEAGAQSLRASQVVDVWTAIDAERPRYESFERDVAMWSAFAEAAVEGGGGVEVAADEFGRPVPPATVGDLVTRLFAGPVGVRPLAIDAGATATRRAEASADTVVLDRRDVLLVFGQVAPGLVSAPNPALTFAINAPFTDLQLAVTGDDVSVEEIVRDLIGEILFFQGNVVFVRTDPVEGGAPEETLLEVLDESVVDDVESATEFLWGPADVEVAETLIDGVDVIVTLGTSYLDFRDARLADDPSDTVEAGEDDEDADDTDDEDDEDADDPDDEDR